MTYKRSIKNPGANLYDKIYSKRQPQPISALSDQQLLALVLSNPTAAASVIQEIGTLESYSTIGEGSRLLHYPGISKATAVRLDALFELATRIG